MFLPKFMMKIDLQIWRSKIKDQDQFQKIICGDLDRTQDQDQLGDLRSLRSRSMIFLQLWLKASTKSGPPTPSDIDSRIVKRIKGKE